MRSFTTNPATRLLAVALSVGVLAAGASASNEESAAALVKSTTERVLEVINKEREVLEKDPGRIYGIVDEYVIPHFDFERMSQVVLAKFWHRATPEQQKKFVAQFQQLLVRTYAAALREYSTQKVEFFPARQRGDGEVSVRTQVVQSGSPPIPIQYEMHMRNGKWMVYDVSIDGVSLVINYRSTFASEIRSNGIDGLIQRLVEHNQRKQ